MVISMDRWKGKVAVVTGASAGIGAAIVEQLVDAGLKVVGLARRKERVEELQNRMKGKNGELYALKADVTKKQDILDAFKWIKENLGPVHILVNNAGIARVTTLVDGDTKLWNEVLNTNVMGLCIATREAVKDMRANNVDGHIVHINSISGHMIPDIQNFNVYGASKHAVTGLTETLRHELNSIKSKIKITSISPGRVKTELFSAMMEGSGIKCNRNCSNQRNIGALLNAEDVADAVLYALATSPDVQIHELIIKPIGEVY